MGDAKSRNLLGLTIRWVSRVLAAAVGLLLPVLPAEIHAVETPAAVAIYAYDGHHHSALPSHTMQERGPPGTYDQATAYDAVGYRSHSPSAHPEGAPTPTAYTYNDPAEFAEISGSVVPASGAAPGTRRTLSPSTRTGVAAKSGVNLGPGVVTRKINWRPNAADPNWGLTGTHMNKHMFGNSKYSLSKIDPDGNADIWRGYMQDLASRPHTGTTTNGMLDIVGTFPRAGGGGNFQFGIRLSPNSNGSFDLITLLTKQ